MTLNRLIDDRQGPVREFLEQQLPDLRAFRARWRAAGSPSILPAGDRPPWGVLGAALDYRIRYFFHVADPSSLVAARADLVGTDASPQRTAEAMAARARGQNAYGNLSAELATLTNRANLLGQLLDEDDEWALCRFCYVLALHEAVARVGLFPTSPLARLSYDANAAEQLALVDEVWVDDLVALARAAHGTLGHLFGQPVILGPLFAGSGDVGGADGDLIVGNTLIEIKTTKNPPERAWLYQLIGYLLLDYDDRYSLTRLGFYVSRIPALITWPTAELLDTLAGRPVDLHRLRSEFRAATEAAGGHAS